MKATLLHLFVVGLLGATLALAGCGSGSDGAQGPIGPEGPDGPQGPEGPEGPGGPTVINASTAPAEFLEAFEFESQILDISISSPPVVTFSMATTTGIPLVGLVPYWEDSNRFVRFTLTKLVPGMNGDPDSWVAYVQDDGEPDYDSGASFVDNGDGTYTFTFLTDVTNVAEVPYEPTLTHRVAGQLGDSSAPITPQNMWLDFVPAGGAVVNTRNIAVMETCNECHDNLVFHGRRFEVEYCVQCHNPDLAEGEGNMSYMIHRIHAAGSFNVLDDAISYEEVTYPQDLENCRKCHDGTNPATAQGDNWKNRPNIAACDGCHEVFENGTHTGGPQTGNAGCQACHSANSIEEYHLTPNATPNNPNLLDGQRSITYELVDASVDGGNNVTVNFRILSDGTPLDLTNLPQDLLDGGRYPGLLLAYALPQDGIEEPMDYNNLGSPHAQPLSLGLDGFSPLEIDAPIGSLSFNAGVMTAIVTDPGSQFPLGATLRAVGLQGYLRQDLNGDGSYDVSLHTPSAVVAVTGDDARRTVVDSASCANCHEWFEGHGGNRVYDIQICTLCHVPNLSSSGRELDLDNPEDAQNLKDMVHGIHSSDFRTRDYEHVRNRSGGSYYNWSEVTFPRGASTSNCTLCHKSGTYELPLPADLLATTVRTSLDPTGNGEDETVEQVAEAFNSVPNLTDWVNTPTASSCFYCHTSADAMAHMTQNGALLSWPNSDGPHTNRWDLGTTWESCAVCHGDGKTADLNVVHNR